MGKCVQAKAAPLNLLRTNMLYLDYYPIRDSEKFYALHSKNDPLVSQVIMGRIKILHPKYRYLGLE